MSFESTVMDGRAAAEARMTDTCRITTSDPDAEPVMDPVSLQYTQPTVTVYEGKCRLGRVDIPNVSQAAGGEASWGTQDMVLSLPVADSENVAADASVEYLTAAMNPSLVGRVFGVVGVMDASQTTARRCRVREVVSV